MNIQNAGASFHDCGFFVWVRQSISWPAPNIIVETSYIEHHDDMPTDTGNFFHVSNPASTGASALVTLRNNMINSKKDVVLPCNTPVLLEGNYFAGDVKLGVAAIGYPIVIDEVPNIARHNVTAIANCFARNCGFVTTQEVRDRTLLFEIGTTTEP